MNESDQPSFNQDFILVKPPDIVFALCFEYPAVHRRGIIYMEGNSISVLELLQTSQVIRKPRWWSWRTIEVSPHEFSECKQLFGFVKCFCCVNIAFKWSMLPLYIDFSWVTSVAPFNPLLFFPSRGGRGTKVVIPPFFFFFHTVKL